MAIKSGSHGVQALDWMIRIEYLVLFNYLDGCMQQTTAFISVPYCDLVNTEEVIRKWSFWFKRYRVQKNYITKGLDE